MTFLLRYKHIISWIVEQCPQTPDKFAHTYAGIGFWLLAALVLRRPLASAVPLVVVIALELANEYVDWLNYDHWTLSDTFADMAATWFWPVVLNVALRSAPWLTRRR